MMSQAVAGCGPPELRPGVDGRWPACSCGPDESTDTGMPVTSRRARPGYGAGTPSRPGTEAPEATGPGSKSLMWSRCLAPWRPLRARRTLRIQAPPGQRCYPRVSPGRVL